MQELAADMKCRIYDRGPLVCRIYPVEISLFIQFDIARKACPPEAWTGDTLLSDGKLVDLDLQWLVEKSRQKDREDVPRKCFLCDELDITVVSKSGVD